MPHYFDCDENESIRAIADVPTNTSAFVLDSKRNKTSTDYLLDIKNSGTSAYSLRADGTIDIKTTVFPSIYLGLLPDENSYADYCYNSMDINIRGDRAVEFYPERTSNTNYLLNTAYRKTSVDPIFEVQNSGASVFKIGGSGQVSMGQVTKAQRSGISAAAGMLIYQTDETPGLRLFDGTNWVRFTVTAD